MGTPDLIARPTSALWAFDNPTDGIGRTTVTNGWIFFDDFVIRGYHMVLDNCGSDRIANSYDLESDDDDGFDATEGAMNFTSASVDGIGVLTGGVAINGVPVVVLGGQGTTAAVIDASDTTQCLCRRLISNKFITPRILRDWGRWGKLG